MGRDPDICPNACVENAKQAGKPPHTDITLRSQPTQEGEEGESASSEKSDGMFHTSAGFILHVHLGKQSQQETFVRERLLRINLEGDWKMFCLQANHISFWGHG